jgi:hypothetical protein
MTNIDELEEMLAKATPGPWYASAQGGGGVDYRSDQPSVAVVVYAARPQNEAMANQALIVALRNQADALLTELRTLRKEKEDAVAALRAIHAARLLKDGTDPGYGWSITKLNRAMDAALPLLRMETSHAG